MRIGFIGLGNMGTPMALRLLAAGHELAVWARTEEATKPAIHEGAIAAATPAEAELGADAVITVLADDAAYEEVFFGVHRLIDALSPGVLHLACGDLSVGLCERLAAEYRSRGVDFAAVKLLGGPADAVKGTLRVVVAGADAALWRARPLLAAFSVGIIAAGHDPSQAYTFKLS